MDATQQRIQTVFTAALAILVCLFLLLVTSCSKKSADLRPTTDERIENKIDDALDRRPGEPVLDAIENGARDPLRVNPDTSIQNKIDDALNRRPGEPVLDAIENGTGDALRVSPDTRTQNKIDDALDRRPGEPVLDVIEQGAKDVKKIKTAIQEAVRDADK
ncbi:MAG: hypothetical protein V4662_10430 [Verrucomicrobiota bacterium]